ncbi:sensor histidine kinase [Streptomyces ziwulingensis]|uniref:Histidine kinase/HSP90-like ATPase domain-containing protein n=1 Tax=Streptomyces ziwulingensis TaxID=1045501 RepID=A0ABP9B730_9ACTN
MKVTAPGPRDAAREREWSAAALLLLLCSASVVGWAVLCLLRPSEGGGPGLPAELATALVCLPCTVLGFVVLTRPGDRATGWLLLVAGTGLALPLLTGRLMSLGDPGPRVLLAAHLFAQLCALAHGYASAVLPLTFPAPHRAGRWLRGYAVLLLAAFLVLVLVATALEQPPGGGPHPLADTGWARLAHTVREQCVAANISLVVVCAVVNVSVIMARWKHALRVHRRGVACFAVVYGPWAYMDVVEEIPLAPAWAVYSAYLVGAAAWYTAVVRLLRRDERWQLGRASRRVLRTALVVIVVVVGCTAAAVAVATVLPGTDRPGALVVAVVAVLIGSGLRPLLSWAGRSVDRLFHGDGARPYEAVRALARQLREAPEPPDVPLALCRSATSSLRFPSALVDVTTRSGPRVMAAAGAAWDGRDGFEFPLCHRGELIGTLRVAPRPGEDRLPAGDAELLRLLGDQATPVMAALRLLEDVRVARRALVVAREEERRRLRRELHDGLGPLLAATRLRLETALSAVDGAPAHRGRDAAPPPDCREALRTAVLGIGEAMTEARRLVDGLGPAVLADRGLVAAVRDLPRRLAVPGLTVVVAVDQEPAPVLPEAVESAVYRIAAEALTNTVRHARARNCEIRLYVTADTVGLSVSDDGRGLPARSRRGAVGLRSMTERAQDLGGTCRVSSGPHGTRVDVVLPTADADAPSLPGQVRAAARTGHPGVAKGGRRVL